MTAIEIIRAQIHALESARDRFSKDDWSEWEALHKALRAEYRKELRGAEVQ